MKAPAKATIATFGGAAALAATVGLGGGVGPATQSPRRRPRHTSLSSTRRP